jgi:hypothetical protein
MGNKRALRAGEYIHTHSPPAAHLPPSTNTESYQLLYATLPNTILVSVLIIHLSEEYGKMAAEKELKPSEPKSLRAKDLINQAMDFAYFKLQEPRVAAMLGRLGRRSGIDVQAMRSEGAEEMIALRCALRVARRTKSA